MGAGAVGDAKALWPLLTVLAKGSESVRALACRALGDVGDARAAPKMTRHLEDPSPVVRLAAYRALRAMTGKDLPFDRAAWERAYPPR